MFVLEDNDTLRSMLASLLEGQGYEVESFSEPGLCPTYSDHECPCPCQYACADVIISDLNMPKVSGLEFLENRKQHGCKVRCRAVMSGGWTEEQREQARRLGCRLFEKPFRFGEVLEWLEECIRGIDPDRKLSNLTDLERKE